MKCDWCNESIDENKTYVVKVGDLKFCHDLCADLYEDNEIFDAYKLLRFRALRDGANA